MELPETDLNELNDTLNTKVKVDHATEEGVITLLKNRIENLNQDIVVKQRSRFQILEEKVKEMLEQNNNKIIIEDHGGDGTRHQAIVNGQQRPSLKPVNA